VPSLEEEMAAIVTPEVAKRQCLTNNDCGDAINKFAEKLVFIAISLLMLRT
jgi:hypothetical protein